MRRAHLLICPVLLLFWPLGFAQESSRGGSAKQDAPKVIETGDMKLAMQDRQSRIADLQHAIDDFQASIRLGAASKEELNRGLEKVATRANLDEATKLLEKETHR